MRITIDTDIDQYDDSIRAVVAAYGFEMDDEDDDGSPPAGNGTANGSAVLPGGWNDKKLRRWAKYLTDDAAEVVRYVAAHAPEVRYDEVARHLGAVKGLPGPVSGKVLGGAMSSGGHARNKLRGAPKTQPIDRDHAQRSYVINERIAEILADELGEPAEA